MKLMGRLMDGKNITQILKKMDLVTIQSLSPYIAPNVLKEVKFIDGI